MDPATEKKYIRSVVRQVHPDLFGAHPYERARNTEALQALNAYADQLSQGLRPQAARIAFYVRGAEGEGLTEIPVELPPYGSLGPLFYAFGLITSEELKQGYGAVGGQGADDRDMVEWLRDTVADAVRTADQHDSLKRVIRDMRMALETRHQLASIQVGGEFAISTDEQRRQIDSLKSLEGWLASLPPEQAAEFEGLSIRLYHPESRPLGTVEYVDTDGAFNLRTQPISSFVADDGTVHVVADPAAISEALPKLDLRRARLLAKLGSVWMQRSRDLSGVLQRVLGVEAVWCDTRTEDSSQAFVLWAGAVLEQRGGFEGALQGRRFAFSLLAHSDHSSPMLDFLASSSVLQVRCDCPPSHLLDFLCSSAGLIANEAAVQVAEGREEEEALLEMVREALGAKHVIRVCSSYEQDKVLSAARRLLECAPAIRLAGVNLEGASLAIDDCYELWDSGFISIPHDFSLSDLKPRLQALLGSGDSDISVDSIPGTANGSANGGGVNGAANSTNGHANDHANGHANGSTNGHANGHANGSANGSANGHANGSAQTAGAGAGAYAGSVNGSSNGRGGPLTAAAGRAAAGAAAAALHARQAARRPQRPRLAVGVVPRAGASRPAVALRLL